MSALTPGDYERYKRQLALPEILVSHQAALKDTRVLMVGAGGLGTAALPYLAGAGVGHIAILDHDRVNISNLHRQTIFKDAQAGQNKAELTAQYLAALNPAIEIMALDAKLDDENAQEICAGFDLILDGSDNFPTKFLLNEISIETHTPLISASVEQFRATVGIFASHNEGGPCYACLFPEVPGDVRNCNEAGVLGTAAGLTGLFQAHLALCFLLHIGDVKAGTVLSLDFKDLRMQRLTLAADPACAQCGPHKNKAPRTRSPVNAPIEIVSAAELADKTFVVIDVRSPEEVAYEPFIGAVNIPLPDLIARKSEIPGDRTVAFVCAANVRSRMAAEMLREYGFRDVCVLDRFSFSDRAA